jgi:hypothetical protein
LNTIKTTTYADGNGGPHNATEQHVVNVLALGAVDRWFKTRWDDNGVCFVQDQQG